MSAQRSIGAPVPILRDSRPRFSLMERNVEALYRGPYRVVLGHQLKSMPQQFHGLLDRRANRPRVPRAAPAPSRAQELQRPKMLPKGPRSSASQRGQTMVRGLEAKAEPFTSKSFLDHWLLYEFHRLCTKITSEHKKRRFIQDRSTTSSVRPRLLVQSQCHR